MSCLMMKVKVDDVLILFIFKMEEISFTPMNYLLFTNTPTFSISHFDVSNFNLLTLTPLY